MAVLSSSVRKHGTRDHAGASRGISTRLPIILIISDRWIEAKKRRGSRLVTVPYNEMKAVQDRASANMTCRSSNLI